MKRLATRRKRWHGSFRSLNSADRLWIYAGTAARQGATWHRHHGDDRPHLHVHSKKVEHHYDHAEMHDDGRGHDHEQPDEPHLRSPGTPSQGENCRSLTSQHGHWHRIIPIADLHLAHQLLVVGLCEVWLTALNAAFVVIHRRSALSARAPPSA